MNFLFFNEKCKYTLSEFEFLQDPADKYCKLGVGASASVKLAREKKTGKLFAIKIIHISNVGTYNSEIYNIKCEIFIHRALDHSNIIKFYGYIQQDLNIYLILEYAENGNVYAYLYQKRFLTDKEIFRFFYQTCLAVQYLHQKDFIHRDIKPENLLLDDQFNVKLCDFGWATQRIQDKRLTFCGTFEYMAPEIAYKHPYDYRVDIWSLGVLLYELIHKQSPYKGRSLPEICNSFAKNCLKFSSNCPHEAEDLIRRILKHNPDERPSLSEILEHPWVTSNLLKETNGSSVRQKVLLHSKSLPMEQIHNFERHRKNNYEPQTTTNAQNKAPKYDTWSNYVKTQQESYHAQTKSRSDTSIIGREHDNLSNQNLSPREDYVLNLINLRTPEQNINIEVKPIVPPFAILKTEQDREKSASPEYPSNMLVNCNHNSMKSPKRNSGHKNKIFEKNIFSPSFKSKLTSMMQQLNISSPTVQLNGGMTRARSTKAIKQKLEQDLSPPHSNQPGYTNYQPFPIDNKENSHNNFYEVNKPNQRTNSHLPMGAFNPKQELKNGFAIQNIKNNYNGPVYYQKTKTLSLVPPSVSMRVNTDNPSYTIETQNYFDKSYREMMNQDSRQENLINGKENIVPAAPVEYSGYQRQKQSLNLNPRNGFQNVSGKKAHELKGILESNVVRCQIPISLLNKR